MAVVGTNHQILFPAKILRYAPTTSCVHLNKLSFARVFGLFAQSILTTVLDYRDVYAPLHIFLPLLINLHMSLQVTIAIDSLG